MFELSTYHVLFTALGAALFIAYWIPTAIFRYPPSSTALIIALGMLFYHLLPNMPEPLNPIQSPVVWEVTSEFVVIIVLFVTGLRIDNISDWQRWRGTIRLLLLAMPLTIGAVAFLGWWLAGMTIAGAIMLGAVLSPTDPVLAGNVQVGPPTQGGEDPIRFTLTTEAGLNDGLAFPFVYLGLAIASAGADPSAWFAEWVLRDLVYRIAVGAAAGVALGWLLGRIVFSMPGLGRLADSGPGVIALAATFLCYGAVELVEGYGFLAVFIAGVFCRRAEEEHAFHRRMHAFSESIEQALTAFLLFALGSTLPLLWPYLDWRHSVIGFGLILFIRPLAGYISLAGTPAPPAQKLAISFLGVRGIGSIYYMAYAVGHIEFVNGKELWALVAFTIFASAVIHGATARFIVHKAEQQSA